MNHMNAFSRSWHITKLSFGVINQDRELLGFALLSCLFSTLFSIAMFFPAIIPFVMDPRVIMEPKGAHSLDSLNAHLLYQYVILFPTYFGLAFIATFFNVCVAYTTKIRFEGGNATFSESYRFAVTRLGAIAQWSIVSATVGVLLRILQDGASRLGIIGGLVAKFVIGLLGMAWSIATVFVVPVLIHENVGPFDAAKRSAQVIKQTWGESLIKTIGLGLVESVISIFVVLLTAAIAFGLQSAFDKVGLVIGVSIGAMILLFIRLIFTVANTIFNTALYTYANNNMVAPGFSEDVLRDAFEQNV